VSAEIGSTFNIVRNRLHIGSTSQSVCVDRGSEKTHDLVDLHDCYSMCVEFDDNSSSRHCFEVWFFAATALIRLDSALSKLTGLTVTTCHISRINSFIICVVSEGWVRRFWMVREMFESVVLVC
jgi:hypothetical protein